MSRKPKKGESLNVSKPYTKIPDGLWLSPEFNGMSTHSRCLFVIMISKWNPYEPTKPFAFLYDEIQKITRFNRHRISQCIWELVKEGFLNIPQRGSYPHNVSLYQINLEPLTRVYPKVNKSLPGYVANMFNKVQE